MMGTTFETSDIYSLAPLCHAEAGTGEPAASASAAGDTGDGPEQAKEETPKECDELVDVSDADVPNACSAGKGDEDTGEPSEDKEQEEEDQRKGTYKERHAHISGKIDHENYSSQI